MLSDQPTKLLNAFVGVWKTEGRTLEGVFGPSVRIKGTDTYKWLAGNHFLIHEVNVLIADERVEALEVMGYDPLTLSYPIYAFDNSGNTSKYLARVKDDLWFFDGLSERAEVKIEEDKIRAKWEKLYRSEWLPWMEVNLRRLIST